LFHKPVAKGPGQSFVGKIQKTLEGFLEENEEGKFYFVITYYNLSNPNPVNLI
jgi:hypothetical protein